jgi:hypothetical protein
MHHTTPIIIIVAIDTSITMIDLEQLDQLHPQYEEQSQAIAEHLDQGRSG